MPVFIIVVLAFVLGGVLIGTYIADERDVALVRSLETASLTWLVLAIFTATSAASDFGPWSDLFWNVGLGLATYLIWRVVVAHDKHKRAQTK